jgi:uncharacterized membrane protein affecting hemolysin expression
MKTKVSKTTNILLRVLIMLFTFGFVYKYLLDRNDWQQWNSLLEMVMNQQDN